MSSQPEEDHPIVKIESKVAGLGCCGMLLLVVAIVMAYSLHSIVNHLGRIADTMDVIESRLIQAEKITVKRE